jgi:hypothetical protein
VLAVINSTPTARDRDLERNQRGDVHTPEPDPVGYVELLKAADPRVKAVDPSIVVLGGPMGATVDYGDYTINPVSFLTKKYAGRRRAVLQRAGISPLPDMLKLADGGVDGTAQGDGSTGGYSPDDTFGLLRKDWTPKAAQQVVQPRGSEPDTEIC